MPGVTSTLIEQIRQDAAGQCLQLPSIPDVALQIQSALDDERKGLSHVARLIQVEPGLAARLIKIANSSLYYTGSPIPDIRRAISHLGLKTTRNLVNCLVMHNVFDVRSCRLQQRIKQLWQHSCRVAAISQVLARVTFGLNPDRSLLAGLLHDIGVLPILVYADQHPVLVEHESLLDEVILNLRAELGGLILRQWGLGEDLQCVPQASEDWTRKHDGPADYGDLVQVAQIHSLFGSDEHKMELSLTQLSAFNKLSLARLGPHAGMELLVQAEADINVTMHLLSG